LVVVFSSPKAKNTQKDIFIMNDELIEKIEKEEVAKFYL
jgi:hypothetical protein